MNNIFFTEELPTGDGYTWTITSKLGHILKSAEEKYGKRDLNYTILGIELTNQSYPQIWFPGSSNRIIIQLTSECMNDINRAVYQAAHEIIHCLSPQGKKCANVLEEGLATFFAVEYTKENGHGCWNIEEVKYRYAYDLVDKLLSYNNKLIKELRTIQPTISLITKTDILSLDNRIPEELIDKLLEIP
jgi:hypothetical protein